MYYSPGWRAAVVTYVSLAVLPYLVGCSGGTSSTLTGGIGGDNGIGGESQQGGTASTQGGASTATGGTNAFGGSKSGGGGDTTGGSGMTGGVTSTGGSALSGGTTSVTVGGTRATGGTSVTGGTNSMGGTKATGGQTGAGGTNPTGGSRSIAGASTSGGAKATGGTDSTGGANATGGAKATGGSSSTSFSICSSAPPAGTRVVSIYVIGDSTASIYTSDLYPRMGWGQVLGDYFSTACAVVKDKALSGRSSKSFYDEGAWTPIRNGLAAGDFVLIQFGHNDEKTDATLHTDPQTTYKQYLTTYVNDTKAKQAFPILLTSIARNQWSGTTLVDTHGAYPPAVRELAASLNVPLVDMTALTMSFLQRIGQTAATNTVFMDLAAGVFPNYPNGNTDNTHLQETGARDVARLFTGDVYRQKLSVAANLKAIPTAP